MRWMLAADSDGCLHTAGLLQAPAGEGAEAQVVAQREQRRAVRIAAREAARVVVVFERRIQRDRRELPPEQRLFAVRTQFRGGGRRAAEAQERDFVDAREQRIEAAEMRKQDRRGLAA